MQNLTVIQIKGQRVLTTRQLATAYETDVKVIQNNFSRNKERYVAGKHYIYMDRDELREVKTAYPQFEGELKRTSRTHFWTEKGALLHAKSLNTDKAWEIYDYLVDFYFRAKETEKPVAKQEPKPERKPPMRTVVDAPENVQIQKAIKEVQKCLYAMDILMYESNKYCSIECYMRFMSCLDSLWTSLGRRILNLRDIEPKQIQKLY